MANAATQQNMSVLFFGEACTEPADMPAVQGFLASNNFESAQSTFAQAQAAHQLLQSAKVKEAHVEHFMRPPKPPEWCVNTPFFIYWNLAADAVSWLMIIVRDRA